AVAGRVAAPLSIAGDGVQARLSAGGIGLSGAARLFGFGQLSVSAGLGGGFDLTRIEPTGTAPDLQAAAAFWARSSSVRTFVEIERVFGKLAVAVALGMEADLLAERYTVRTGSEARDVFVPRRFRPEAAVLIGAMF